MDTTCVMCRAKPGDRQSTAGRWFCDTCVSSLPSEQDTLAALNGEIQALTVKCDLLTASLEKAEAERNALARSLRDNAEHWGALASHMIHEHGVAVVDGEPLDQQAIRHMDAMKAALRELVSLATKMADHIGIDRECLARARRLLGEDQENG